MKRDVVVAALQDNHRPAPKSSAAKPAAASSDLAWRLERHRPRGPHQRPEMEDEILEIAGLGIELLGGATSVDTPGECQYDCLHQGGLARFVGAYDEVEPAIRLDRQVPMEAVATHTHFFDHEVSVARGKEFVALSGGRAGATERTPRGGRLPRAK